MKPKNLFFCRAIGRTKMLFETESKANNFLRFNGSDILEETGKAPVRSYYCPFCCGWHVTSNSSKEVGEQIDKDLRDTIDSIEDLNAKAKQSRNRILEPEEDKIKSQIKKRIEEAHSMMLIGKFDEAEDLLDNCTFDIDDLEKMGYRHELADKSLQDGRTCLKLFRDMKGLSEEERKAVLKLPSPNKIQRQSMDIIKNLGICEQLEAVIDNQEDLIASEDQKVVSDIIAYSQNKISEISGTGSNEAKKYFNLILTDIIEKRKKRTTEKDAESNQEDTPQGTLAKESYLELSNPKEDKLPEDISKELVSLIDRLMKIRSRIESGDDGDFADEIDVCYLILEQLGVETEETKIIKSQLDQLMSSI